MPTKLVLGQELGQKMCAAMGIDIRHVVALSVSCIPGEAATITLTRLVQEDEADALAEVLEQFSLLPKAE